MATLTIAVMLDLKVVQEDLDYDEVVDKQDRIGKTWRDSALETIRKALVASQPDDFVGSWEIVVSGETEVAPDDEDD